MQLCSCVTALAGTKPCPQWTSNHYSPSFLVLSLGGAVLYKLIHLLYQIVLQQTPPWYSAKWNNMVIDRSISASIEKVFFPQNN